MRAVVQGGGGKCVNVNKAKGVLKEIMRASDKRRILIKITAAIVLYCII